MSCGKKKEGRESLDSKMEKINGKCVLDDAGYSWRKGEQEGETESEKVD